MPAEIPRPALGNAVDNSLLPGGNGRDESWYDRFSDDSSYDMHISRKETQAMVPATLPRLEKPGLLPDDPNTAPGEWYDSFNDDSSYDSHIHRKGTQAMPSAVEPPLLEASPLDNGPAEIQLVAMAPRADSSSADDSTASGGSAVLLTTVLPVVGGVVLCLLAFWLLCRRRQKAKTSELPIVMPTPDAHAALAAKASTISVLPKKKLANTKPLPKQVHWISKPSFPLGSGRLCLQRVPQPRSPANDATVSPTPAATAVDAAVAVSTTSSPRVFSN